MCFKKHCFNYYVLSRRPLPRTKVKRGGKEKEENQINGRIIKKIKKLKLYKELDSFDTGTQRKFQQCYIYKTNKMMENEGFMENISKCEQLLEHDSGIFAQSSLFFQSQN